MLRVTIVGCGAVGAAIAYELSQVSGLEVVVLDRQFPPSHPKATAQDTATGAALGVLMGIISQKTQGRLWRLREASLRRYDTLIPELEAITGLSIPYNYQGILKLVPGEEELPKWQQRVQVRATQGWGLEIWNCAQVQERCPHLEINGFDYAIYSPQDRQVDPVALTAALVDAAQRQGVEFQFGVAVEGLVSTPQGVEIRATTGVQKCDRAIIAAGIGSSALQPWVKVRPVLGQAVCYQGQVLGDPDFQPVITANDVHLVPAARGEYWVGATVEFPVEGDRPRAEAALLEQVKQSAIAFCPGLNELTLVSAWSGLRPRPEGMSAPVIAPVPNQEFLWLATGHYRNGILLAPATAQAVRDLILSELETEN